MCQILLSINPEHVENIFNGTKKYEYRKTNFKRNDIDKIIIYSTTPIKKVVGEVEVLNILNDKKNNAIAFKLGNYTKYTHKKDLSELGIVQAPQSFIYL
ncbi:MAG: ASCH domain-containing protein [Lachnospirales bacterium]